MSVSINSMAIELEDIIRTNGATPATIGVIDGQVHIGELVVCCSEHVYKGPITQNCWNVSMKCPN